MDYEFINNAENKLFSRKNIISFLILAIVVLAIPLGVKLLLTQQAILKSRATGTEITFPELKQNADGNYVSQSPNIKLQLNSPFGPQTSKSRTQ